MTNEVRHSYDAMAERYASLFLTDIDENPFARDWLAKFAKRAAHQPGPVADLGCGPGHIVSHLTKLGLDAFGLELSPGQLAQARKAFPNLEFRLGNLAALDHADASLGGIVSRYSIIHAAPRGHGAIFNEWRRVLHPGAPVLVSFFGSLTPEAHGKPFDHMVVTAYELFPDTVARQLQVAGFTAIETATKPPLEDGRPFTQATILATGG